jgi:hypothetical protein
LTFFVEHDATWTSAEPAGTGEVAAAGAGAGDWAAAGSVLRRAAADAATARANRVGMSAAVGYGRRKYPFRPPARLS